MPVSGYLLIALNLAGVIALAMWIASRPVSVVDPMWALLIGFTINYCLRPTLINLGHGWGLVYTGYYPPALLARNFDATLLLAALFLAAMAAGYLPGFRIRHFLGRWLPDIQVQPSQRERRYLAVVELFVAVGCVATYQRLRAIGWSGSLVDLLTGHSRNQVLAHPLGMGVYEVGVQMAAYGWVLHCFHWTERRLTGHSTAQGTWLWGWNGVVTLIIFMIAGSRSAMAIIVFAPFACYYALVMARAARRRVRRRMRWGQLARTLALVLLIAGPLGLILKNAQGGVETTVNLAISAWDAFEPTAVGLQVIHPNSYFEGRTYWEDFVDTYLPRQLFPAKAKRYGILLVQDKIWPALSGASGTFPPGMIMEAYANGGIVAVAMVGFILGLFCRLIYERLIVGSWFWIVQMVILFEAFASFRSFGAILANTFVLLLPILLVVALICRLTFKSGFISGYPGAPATARAGSGAAIGRANPA